MLRFDIRTAVLAGFEAREEDDAASPFGVALEHDSASLFQSYGVRQLAWLERWLRRWRREVGRWNRGRIFRSGGRPCRWGNLEREKRRRGWCSRLLCLRRGV